MTEGRRPARVTAPTVTAPRQGVAAPAIRPRPTIERAEIERAEIERRTRLGLHLASVAGRTLAVGAMLLVVYLAVTQAWIPAATDGLLGWYSSTIAPHLAFDPSVSQLPVGTGELFGNPQTPSFVIAD